MIMLVLDFLASTCYNVYKLFIGRLAPNLDNRRRKKCY